MKKRLFKSLIVFLVFIIIGTAYFLIWKNTGISIVCPFYFFLGLYCPGCGITRALISLVNLDFYSAFRNNIGVAIISPFILYILIKKYIKYLKGEKTYFNKIDNIICIILIIFLVLYGILRNIPEFNFLAPLN